jgi:SAM-dependent methyltransferase
LLKRTLFTTLVCHSKLNLKKENLLGLKQKLKHLKKLFFIPFAFLPLFIDASPIDDKTLFWTQVEQTPSFYKPETPVIFNGKTLADKAWLLQKKMFDACSLVNPFAAIFFNNPPTKVLDLGSGKGSNSLPMAINGSFVTAIDQSKELLEIFCMDAFNRSCSSENLRLYPFDITLLDSYGGPYKLTLAIDILPYIPPKKLKSTMEKIYTSLDSDGILVGTIFTEEDTEEPIQEILQQLGAHFYKNGEDFVLKLIEHSGFEPLAVEKRPEGGTSFIAVKKQP